MRANGKCCRKTLRFPAKAREALFCAAMILRRRLDANSKRPLTASEPINETPALRAIRFDPQSQRAAIGKRADSGAAPNSRPVSGMLASDLSAAAAYQPILADANKRPRTPSDANILFCQSISGRFWTPLDGDLVPLAGVEPALLAELDFELSASTNSATGARTGVGPARGADISFENAPVNPSSSEDA